MQFYALLEEWPGESIVFFQTLPGCFSAASLGADALKAAPLAIETYLGWLKENNATIVEGEVEPLEVVLAEHLRSNGSACGPLFQADLATPDDLEMQNALNVAATTRALIIEMISLVPEHVYEQPSIPGSWSLARHLRHILEREDWYVSRLTDQPALVGYASSMNADDISMQIFENAMDSELFLQNLTPDERARVFVHDGESWTAAKVLRRMTHHLREHYAWMAEIVKQFPQEK